MKLNKILSWITKSAEDKAKLREIVQIAYPDQNQSLVGRYTQQIFNFLVGIETDHFVVAMDGAKVRGIGVVENSYYYESGASYFRHRRPVKWLSLDEWKMDNPEGLRTTVHQFKKHPSNLLDIESKVQLEPTSGTSQPPELEHHTTGFTSRIESILNRKGQVILYGPPGTGKTYWAKRASTEIAAIKNFGKLFDTLSESEKNQISDNYIRVCSFHPAYGYEDFIEAYRPVEENSNLKFELKPGIFKRLCEDAKQHPGKLFFLIIDEINRGDIPRIFGELITSLELDKRGTSLKLPVSGEDFRIPSNIQLIATMNTADRSIALLDTALRRRFGFIEMMPDYNILKKTYVDDIPLESWLRVLNKRIRQNLGLNGRNLQIGHSYLLSNGKPISDYKLFMKVVREDIIPLLSEYCYEDFSMLERILGGGLVNAETYEIKDFVFDEGNWDKIKQLLSLSAPDLLSESAPQEGLTEEVEEEEEKDTEDS